MDLDRDVVVLHEQVRVEALRERKFSAERFWSAVEPWTGGSERLRVDEVGRSALGRPLRRVRFGRGPTTVLVWSQMHGDEPTGTMALADLLRFLSERGDDARVARWEEQLSLVLVPVLNPDGAARFQRRNAQGIDMNRDARARLSPEIRALFRVHAEDRPDFAIELHDEDTKTRVGRSDRMSGASLIAPTFDAALGDNETRVAAKRLCVVVHRAIEPLLGEHVARYREDYLPTSIGTVLQQMGTPTVLFESGWWPLDPEMQFLRKVNFVGLVAALDSAATRAHEHMGLAEYDAIPVNDRNVFDVLIRGGQVVIPGAEPYRADLGIDFRVALDLAGGHLADAGDLADYSGRDILIAEGMFVHPAPEALAEGEDGAAFLELGRPASLVIRRGVEPDSPVVWVVERGVARRAEEPAPAAGRGRDGR